jgi:hypothetical protein
MTSSTMYHLEIKYTTELIEAIVGKWEVVAVCARKNPSMIRCRLHPGASDWECASELLNTLRSCAYPLDSFQSILREIGATNTADRLFFMLKLGAPSPRVELLPLPQLNFEPARFEPTPVPYGPEPRPATITRGEETVTAGGPSRIVLVRDACADGKVKNKLIDNIGMNWYNVAGMCNIDGQVVQASTVGGGLIARNAATRLVEILIEREVPLATLKNGLELCHMRAAINDLP